MKLAINIHNINFRIQIYLHVIKNVIKDSDQSEIDIQSHSVVYFELKFCVSFFFHQYTTTT